MGLRWDPKPFSPISCRLGCLLGSLGLGKGPTGETRDARLNTQTQWEGEIKEKLEGGGKMLAKKTVGI